jgi:protein gp37
MNETRIRWTNYSSNPIRAMRLDNGKKGWACTMVPGGPCDNCYAQTLNKRWGTGLTYEQENMGKVKLWLDEREFRQWAKIPKPSRIFVVDMSDLFHPDVPREFQNRIFDEMEKLPWHKFQILTKRPGIMARFIENRYGDWRYPPMSRQKPTSNIWLGTSVGTEAHKPFIDVLRRIPADVRFLSLEPLIGDLGELDLTGISWVIVGGESGPGYRKMDLDWARKIRDQCLAQKVAFFYKQDSGPRTEMNPILDGIRWEQYPE